MATITGNKTDETFSAQSGVSYNGQGGFDTLVFTGSYDEYAISLKDTGNIKTTVSWEDGTQTLDTKWIEKFVFSDGVYDVATGHFEGNEPQLPTVSISDASANEEAGTITFTITLSTASSGPVSFNYGTADGSATAGSDYVMTAGSAIIAAGQTSITITVPLLNDKSIEQGGETFQLNLSNASGATILDGLGSGSILEQDQLITGTEIADSLIGGLGDDTINGLEGDDGLGGGPGNDTLNGGAGYDRAIYTNSGAAITVMLANGTVTNGGSTDSLQSIEFIRGSNLADTYNAVNFGVSGNANNSSEGNNLNGFEGLGGNDTVTGNGNTRIEFTNATSGVTVTFNTATTGTAIGDASVGTDTFSAVSRVRGSQHNDLIVNAGVSANVFDGQGGFDTVSYANAASAIIANLQSGSVSGGGGNDSLVDNTGAVTIESIIGTGFNDSFVASGTNTFDGSFGSDQLSMNNALNNVVTAISVETVFGGGGNDTLNFIVNDGSAGQSISLGGGTNTLNLGGLTTSFGLTLNNITQVNGHAGNVDETVSLLNVQGGTNFDLGQGNDTLNLYNDGTFVNVVTVKNVEQVQAFGFDSDQITIAGNSDGVTTVTAGGGADLITASGDTEYIRFEKTSDSPYDLLGAGQRDVVFDFNADQDKFVFDGPEFVGPVGWEIVNFGGQDVILIDREGGVGWDMAIQVQGLTGTLDNGDFLVI